jgi:hypothetical protein
LLVVTETEVTRPLASGSSVIWLAGFVAQAPNQLSTKVANSKRGSLDRQNVIWE